MPKYVLAVLAAAGLLALPLFAAAEATDRLIEKYTPLAGSTESSKSLVTGLRDGTEVKLSSSVKFTPPTRKMGNGNVDIALALAQASLKEQGITSPTPEQLQTALIGDAGSPGILEQRADGKGWGQIAQSLGFRLGEVMRSAKADRPEGVASRVDKPERPMRPERPEKPERHGR